jgi:hypothetical protein
LFASSSSVAHRREVDWSALLSLLEDDDRRAPVRLVYPQSRRESYLGALRSLDPSLASEVMAAGRKLQTASQLIDWPTVAVAGMLNSGKTSLVSTFLSPQGRLRTLRGSGNHQGTHRFVLWLPSRWESEVELWSLLMTRIGDALGGKPEMLSQNPSEAHLQYNNAVGREELLGIPLVATDDALNNVGIGLLDCPDIVSDESFGLGSPQKRRQLLGRASTLCSAFLVVASAESSRDSTLGDLLRIASDLMPGVPRMLAVNKVRSRQSPEQVYEAFKPLCKNHGISTIYAAYDFDIPDSKAFIPRPISEDRASQSVKRSADQMPVFFSLDPDPDKNPPAAIEPDRMLAALPQRLDRGQLFEKFRLALQSGLQAVIWDRGFQTIQKHANQAEEQTRRAHDCLLESALEFFAHREIGGMVTELRLLQNKRVVRQLSESFVATAPWYARWGVQMNAKLRGMFSGFADFWRRFTPSALAQATAEDVRNKLSSGEFGTLLTPKRLVAAVERFGGSGALPHLPEINEANCKSYWLDAAEAAILRFERDGVAALDPRRLDEATSEMWTRVPTHKKLVAGLTPLAATLAAFGGVMMIPVDFGASAVGLASIPELFAATGLAAYATLWAGDKSMRNVGHQAARQQLGDFHSILCDSLGVARPDPPLSIRMDTVSEILSISKVPTGKPVDPERVLPTMGMRREFCDELERLLPRSSAPTK